MTPTPGSPLALGTVGKPVAPPTTPVLQVPPQAVELVAGFEGFRSKVYPDPGTGGAPWTIGYGSTRDENGRAFSPDTPAISQDRAKALLGMDLGKAAREIATSVHVALSEPCRAALCSFIYNLGAGNFRSSALLRLINAGRLKEAADELPKWNRSDGHVMNGLVVRRAAERKVFLTGVTA